MRVKKKKKEEEEATAKRMAGWCIRQNKVFCGLFLVVMVLVGRLAMSTKEDEALSDGSKTWTKESTSFPDLERFDRLALTMARPFTAREEEDWCVAPPADSNMLNPASNPTDIQGLYYVRNPKSGSSTHAGVALRIANRNGCRLFSSHFDASSVLAHPKAIVWSTVREPRSHALSCVYYFVIMWALQQQPSGRGRGATNNITLTPKSSQDEVDDVVLQHLPAQVNRQVQYLVNGRKPPLLDDKTDNTRSQEEEDAILQTHVKKLLESYDFIGVLERMDESLVVLKLLYNLHHGDILYLSAKQASSGWDHAGAGPNCVKTVKPVDTPRVRAYLNSKEFNALNWDHLLYRAVNLSLDQTIDRLGRARVVAQVKRHRELLQLAQDQCGPQAIFPCSDTGVKQLQKSKESCYVSDQGCGYHCLDEFDDREIHDD